jgi:methionyl aminopeptidase
MPIIIKSEEQIDGIRKSCQLASDTLDHLVEFIKPGVTTEEINRRAEEYIRRYGGVPACLGYLGFPKAICTSMNEVVCHGIPGEDMLEEGDIINVDVTTILNGYYGDTSTMFAVGKVSDNASKLMAVAKDCLDVGIVQVRAGVPFGNIGKAISNYAQSRGYSVVHQFCGHGTGIMFHEEPNVRHDDRFFLETLIEPGMIFTIEPMINEGVAEAVIDGNDKWTVRTVDGKLSAQYEHTVLCTENGVEVLTR